MDEIKSPKKPNWFKRHKILTSIAISIIVFTFIGALSGGSPTNTNQSNQPSNIKLSDEEKTKLFNWAKDLLAIAGDADKAFSKWQDGLDSGSNAESYLNADVVINLNDRVRDDVKNFNLPNINISNEQKDKLNQVKEDIEVAYFSKNDALENTKKYLNTQDLEQLSKYKQNLELANSFTLSSVTNLFMVLTENNIDTTPLSK